MINNNGNTAIKTGSETMPVLVNRENSPDGPMYGMRRTDCLCYSRCGLKASLVKKAKNFTCEGCDSYQSEEEWPIDGSRKLALVEKNPVAEGDGTSDASPGTQKEEPANELFETQRPYTLKDVPVRSIDADCELKPALYRNLSVSIGLLGPLQTVILQEKEDGTYAVWAGRRRVLAAKSLGKDKLPAMVFGKDVPESLIDIYAVTENMNRASNPAQEAEALSRIMAAYSWTGQEAAKKLGIPAQQIRNRVKLMKLIPGFFKKCVKGELSHSVAKKISSLSVEKQNELLGEEKITLKDVQSVCKETRLRDLLSQDELFSLPQTPARSASLSEAKMTLADIIRSGEGNIKSLEKALVYIESYESSRGEE